MASFVYNSFWDDLAKGAIDCDTDSFKVMLVTSSYIADKDSHLKRSSVTNEITGTGYTAGGIACTVTVTKNTTLDRTIITLGAVNWTGFTGTSRGAVYYKARGGASSADEVVAFNDFGVDVPITSSVMTIANSIITLQN